MSECFIRRSYPQIPAVVATVVSLTLPFDAGFLANRLTLARHRFTEQSRQSDSQKARPLLLHPQ
jgi:hypothetical protein